MKKLTLLLLLTFYTYNSSAEEYRSFRVVCDKTETIMATLKEKYQELPIIAGSRLSNTRSTISVWGNPATETFTILDSFGDMSCVLAVGDNVSVLLPQGEEI
jgi:hypothetical protein